MPVFVGVDEHVIVAVLANDVAAFVPGDSLGLAVPEKDAPLGVGDVDAKVEVVEDGQEGFDVEREIAGHNRDPRNGAADSP